MLTGARRFPARPRLRPARRALWTVALVAMATGARAEITSASYGEPTTRYDHGVLGDAVEWGALHLSLSDGTERRHILPDTRVFEDTEPRLVDLNGDGAPEVIVVETDIRTGASLAVYGEGGKIAATPHIGQSNRWLAPLGAADLDSDGRVEIAYIDRPHLAKTLRIWRFESGQLVHVADRRGLTNHRIGEDFISGGIRDCGAGPEIVTVDAGWQRVVASTLSRGAIESRDIGPFSGPDSLTRALECK